MVVQATENALAGGVVADLAEAADYRLSQAVMVFGLGGD